MFILLVHVSPAGSGRWYMKLWDRGPGLGVTEPVFLDFSVKNISDFSRHLLHLMNHICQAQPQLVHGPFTRYVILWVAHAPEIPGTFSPPPTSKETASYWSQHTSRHLRHARSVMHVGIDNPRWRGKRSRHSRRMHNPQFCVSGKRPMGSPVKNER